MYLPEHDLVVTRHAAAHWVGRCGHPSALHVARQAVAGAVAAARPATRRERLEMDHWAVRRDEWTDRITLRWGDVAHLVHPQLDVALVVVLADPPVVVTCIPYLQMRAEAVVLRRRRKRRVRHGRRMAKRLGHPMSHLLAVRKLTGGDG